MNKENVGLETLEIKNSDKRSEIVNKANYDNDSKDFKKNISIELNDTMALNDILKKINLENDSFDKRSEISGKFYEESDKILEKEVSNKSNSEYEIVGINRSEILNKFVVDEHSLSHEKKLVENISEDIELVDTIALDEIIDNINISDESYRSEIDNKISDIDTSKVNKIEDDIVDDLVNEEKEDKIQEKVESISITVVLLIVIICSILGVFIGYLLYSLSMGNNLFAVILNHLHDFV